MHIDKRGLTERVKEKQQYIKISTIRAVALQRNSTATGLVMCMCLNS